MKFPAWLEVARAMWTFPSLGFDSDVDVVAWGDSETRAPPRSLRSFSTPGSGFAVGKCTCWRADCSIRYSSLLIGSCAHYIEELAVICPR